MPTIITRGAASARGFGFGASAGGLAPIPDASLNISQFSYQNTVQLSTNFTNIFAYQNPSDPNPYVMTVSEDGNYFYINDYGNDVIFQFAMNTPFDLTTATTAGYKQGNIGDGQSNGHMGMTWEPNGTFFIIGNYATGPMVRYNVSTPWMVDTIVSSSVGSNINNSGSAYTRVVSRDGLRVTTQYGNSNDTNQYNFTTAWQVNSINSSIARTTTTSPGTGGDMFNSCFSYEGQWFFVIDSQAQLLRQFASASAFNIPNGGTTTASYSLSLTGASFAGDPRMTEFVFVGGQRHLYVLQQRGNSGNSRQIGHWAKLT